MSNAGPNRTPLRTNVLILMGAGYVVVLAMFLLLVWQSADMAKAYDVIQGPLMALIGGSLAISKDLIPIGRSEGNPDEAPADPDSRDPAAIDR